jgi:prepilin peptidase CpaA
MLPLSVAWAFVVMAVAAGLAVVWDLRAGRIPNAVTLPAVAIGLIGHTLFGGLAGGDGSLGLFGAVAGLAMGFGPMLAIVLLGGVGMGDAKLMAAVGALGGWRFALATLLYGVIVAGALAIVIMIRRRIVRRTLGRVLRFLALALTPRGAPPPTEGSPTVPLGLALGLGIVGAMIEMLVAGGWTAWASSR